MQTPRDTFSDDFAEHIADQNPDEFPNGSAGRRRSRFKNHFWHNVNRVRALLRRPEPCDASELAGFFDGDGCFYNAQKQVGCNITQCHYPTLRRIQKCYGGTMYKRDP